MTGSSTENITFQLENAGAGPDPYVLPDSVQDEEISSVLLLLMRDGW